MKVTLAFLHWIITVLKHLGIGMANQLSKILRETSFFPRDFTHTNIEEDNIQYFGDKAGKDAFIPFRIDLNQETFTQDYDASIVSPISYTKAFPVTEEVDQYPISKMLKAFFVADNLKISDDVRNEMAKGFIKRYEISEDTDYQHITAASTAFFNCLKSSFSIKKVYRKYPVKYIPSKSSL